MGDYSSVCPGRKQRLRELESLSKVTQLQGHYLTEASANID